MDEKKSETKKEEQQEKKELVKEQKEKIVPAFKPIVIRDYSKVIFFYPLFFYSAVAWFIEHFFASGLGQPTLGWVALIWIAIFFVNLFVVAFYFPTTKFFLLFLVIVIIGLVVMLLYVLGYINFSAFDTFIQDLLTLDIKSRFYGVMTISLGVILLFVLLGARFRYVRIEVNEVLIKTVLLGEVKRFPTSTIRYKKEIADVFEYLALGAGKISFTFGPDASYVLNTVPMVNKIADKIDDILDVVQVSIAKKP
nr:hypothetical protein [Candidatus Sigynarchaeota archaeon]